MVQQQQSTIRRLQGRTEANKTMESGRNDKVIKLNIGGTVFKTYTSSLNTFAGSKLANAELLDEYYDRNDEEYFFDRNPIIFAYIIDACRKGAIHLPGDVCGVTFRKELEFWEISPAEVAPCCWRALYQSDEDLATMSDLIKQYNLTKHELLMLGDHTWRNRLWQFIDQPTSSKPAMVWSVFITIVIMTLLLMEALSTIPEFSETVTHPKTKMVLFKFSQMMGLNNATYEYMLTLQPHNVQKYVFIVCNVILTVEFIIAFLVCPMKKSFAKSVVRYLIFVSYMSFWAGYAFPGDIVNSAGLMRLYLFIGHLTVFKVFRLFLLAEHVPAFHVIKMTFTSSKQELIILVSILGLLVVVFGEFMLYFELFHNGEMKNRFAAMYWAIITITTVGYGDYTPSTPAGHLVACVCAVCGLLVLSLPIGVIASTFCTFFNFRKYAHKQLKLYGTGDIKIQN